MPWGLGSIKILLKRSSGSISEQRTHKDIFWNNENNKGSHFGGAGCGSGSVIPAHLVNVLQTRKQAQGSLVACPSTPSACRGFRGCPRSGWPWRCPRGSPTHTESGSQEATGTPAAWGCCHFRS